MIALIIGIASGIATSTAVLHIRRRLAQHRCRLAPVPPVDTDTATPYDRALLAYEEVALRLEEDGAIDGHEVLAIAGRWSTTITEVDELYRFLTFHLTS